MERHFDTELNSLKAQLIKMATQVEQAIGIATDALQSRDVSQIGKVYEIENSVNQSHISIDEACVKLLALQQPLAADLRLIVAVIKINTDLERMGDQAVNIAHNCEKYMAREDLKPLVDLPPMSHEVRLMVRETIDSFVRHDEHLARAVLLRDDGVDRLKHKIFKDVLELLKTRPADIEQGLSLILIARNLERIGDHATNIAEDVIFAITGEDIRHAPRVETVKDAFKP